MNTFRAQSEAVHARSPHMSTPMIETAVAERYGISREAQDAYSLLSQQRTATATRAGRFAVEIVPLPSRKAVIDKSGGETRYEEITLERDEGQRGDTTLEGLGKLEPVWSGANWLRKVGS